MFPLSALLAHAELKTRAKRPSAEPPSAAEARRAVRITRYGNLTLYPRVERAEAVDMADPFAPGESMSSEVIDAAWEEPRVFKEIQRLGWVAEDEMDRVFNRGVGMALVVDPGSAGEALRALEQAGQRASVIGEVVAGEGVAFR